ncbi:MAG: flagellar hook capping FlgD N-terminal domain-containing protein [Hyphomicrobiales bacterium]
MVDIASSAIAPVANGLGATVPSSGTVNDREELVQNFDTFLQLLVAQIQNQDPTDPVETETFTQQLVQFSELEQSIQSNDNLETILSSIESQNAASVVSYIGSTVNAQGNTAVLTNGEATFNVQAGAAIPEAQITIRDSLGAVVLQSTQQLQQGNNQFVFDGQGTNGRQFEDGGAFTISVTGNDVNENPVNISTSVSGIVDGVDFSGAVPSLLIGTTNVPITAVNSVTNSI